MAVFQQSDIFDGHVQGGHKGSPQASKMGRAATKSTFLGTVLTAGGSYDVGESGVPPRPLASTVVNVAPTTAPHGVGNGDHLRFGPARQSKMVRTGDEGWLQLYSIGNVPNYDRFRRTLRPLLGRIWSYHESRRYDESQSNFLEMFTL